MSAIPWHQVSLNLGVTAAALLVVMLVMFAFAVVHGKHRVIDAVWGAAFALVAVISLLMSHGHGDLTRRILITVLTGARPHRLAVHIGRRGRGAPEDPRYEALLDKAGGNRAWAAFTRIYLLQGFLIWFVSLPIQVGQYSAGSLSRVLPILVLVLGCALWLVGFAFESIGDRQLAQFKADPANKGRLLTSGLRRYTRHPNYFGDACVWWGLFLVSAGSPAVLLFVLSPIVMNWFLARGSGTPLLDKHLARTRPDFAEYAARTSGFFPRRPSS